MVDVGTGFLVQKVASLPFSRVGSDRKANPLQRADDAKVFYQSKVEDLTKTLQGVEGVLQQKTGNIRAIDEGMSPCDVCTHGHSTNRKEVIRKKVTTTQPQDE